MMSDANNFSRPLLSIIVALYNTIDYLDRFFLSLSSSDFDDYEMVIVDDQSTDGSYERAMLEASQNNRIKVIRASEKLLPDRARDLAYKNASGKYVIYLDSDDEFSSDYLSSMVAFAEQNNLDMVVSTCQRIDEKNCRVGKPEFLSKKSMPLVAGSKRKVLLRGRYGGWNRMAKKEYLDSLGYTYLQAELPLFIMQFYKKTRVGYVNRGLYFYRIRKASVSSKGVPSRMINYNALEPLDWFLKETIDKPCLNRLEVYLYRMILPYILYKKAALPDYNFKKDIKYVAKTLKYNFFKGILNWPFYSKRDRFILLTFIFHWYWPAFYFIKRYKS